jgi:hypothetical protein
MIWFTKMQSCRASPYPHLLCIYLLPTWLELATFCTRSHFTLLTSNSELVIDKCISLFSVANDLLMATDWKLFWLTVLEVQVEQMHLVIDFLLAESWGNEGHSCHIARDRKHTFISVCLFLSPSLFIKATRNTTVWWSFYLLNTSK